jgi:hypothetical protein
MQGQNFHSLVLFMQKIILITLNLYQDLICPLAHKETMWITPIKIINHIFMGLKRSLPRPRQSQPPS